MDMQAVVWLVLLVLLLAVEAVTLGLSTIWFAGGALAAFVAAVAGAGLPVQIALFFAVSILLLIFTRPAAMRWLEHKKTRTNARSLVGDTGIVTEEINNLESRGQVQVRGQIWTARTVSDESRVLAGSRVKIEKISGVKLIVKEEQR